MKNTTPSCFIRWHPPITLSDKSSTLVSWLQEPGSLTLRLRTLTTHFHVEVLHESWQVCSEDEIQCLGLSKPQSVWVRETLLCDEQKNLVFARSVFPEATLQGKGEVLKTLGNRSLGDFLFTDPNWSRSSFAFNCLQPSDFYCTHLENTLSLSKQILYARRSKFYFFAQPLIITEIFLPQLLEIIQCEPS